MNNKKGFTLIELLVVIAILAIIGVIVVNTVSDTLEKATIGAFKTTNDMIIKEVKTRINKNKLGLNETIACLNYGENSCTDIYDISKEDYALSINDLGDYKYDIILVGKGKFEDIDVDGNGNNILCTYVEGENTKKINIKTEFYIELIKYIVNLEEKLPLKINQIYENLNEEFENEIENFNGTIYKNKLVEFENDLFLASEVDLDNNNKTSADITFAFKNDNGVQGNKVYCGEPLFDRELFYYNVGNMFQIKNLKINAGYELNTTKLNKHDKSYEGKFFDSYNKYNEYSVDTYKCGEKVQYE